MRTMPKVILGLVALSVALAASAQDDSVRRAQRLLNDGRNDQAIELLSEVLRDDPTNATALLALANAHHAKGDYERAIEANRRAAETGWAAPTARYNEACALSILGRVDDAKRALEQAVAAGFLDFDLMAIDADLDNLRAEHAIAMPAPNDYTSFDARNRVELAYKVITPAGYDSAKSYPALVLFPAGNGTRSADWAIENLAGPDESREWIIVYPIAPEQGWFTHPAHHALNDLLDEILDTHRIEGGKFHVAGYASGARVAATYSQMSREYFLSLTTFSAGHWDRWPDDELAGGFGLPVRLVVGASDEHGRTLNRHVEELIGDRHDLELVVVDGDDHTLTSVWNGRLLDHVPRSD